MSIKNVLVSLYVFFLVACAGTSTKNETSELIADAPIPVKVVIVTMFEIGEDEGDTAGEFQLWKERLDLDTRFSFPNSHHDIFMNQDKGVMGIVTGMGTAKSTSAIMALGLDSRFDFSKTYWMVAGISGIDPEDASIGSAVWAEYLVDGDLAHEIDPREMPKNWQHGYFPLFSEPGDPFEKKPEAHNGEMYQLNSGLVNWAYELTKDVDLPDSEPLQEARKPYTQHPKALQKPSVLKGDQLAGMTFWHGEYLNAWANSWVDYWTEGKGEFVTSAMEDTGTYLSLKYLSNIDKVDVNRLLVLRTGSNFTMQPPGKTAAENLMLENEGYAGLQVSLESAYLVGKVVVDELLENWDTYKNNIPE